MGKSGSATTTQRQQLPAWLQGIMKPYLSESVGSALTMQRQGNQVLQGGDYRDATPASAASFGSGGGSAVPLDPNMLAAYFANKGGPGGAGAAGGGGR